MDLTTHIIDGTIKMWNFNNGQLLQELIKKDSTEVTGIAYIDMKESKYIVATGWNRKVTMFLDDPDSLTIYPIFSWPDNDSASGAAAAWHKDDILSLAFCPPSTLATSSYDGEILVCNLNSGHILQKLQPPDDGKIDFSKIKVRSIDQGIF
jgi:WD40 repeat protein